MHNFEFSQVILHHDTKWKSVFMIREYNIKKIKSVVFVVEQLFQ